MYKASRKYPDVLCRIPLFLPLKKREALSSTTFTNSWGTVAFDSVPLTTTDEDLFLTCINEGTYFEQYNCIGYKADSVYDLTRDMGKTTSATTSQIIMNSLTVLSTASVRFQIPTYNISFSGRLADVEFSTPNRPVKVAFNHVISEMMTSQKNKGKTHTVTLRNIDMQLRSGLCLTGKAVLRFICGHKANLSYKFPIEDIHMATAPHSRIDNFRGVLKETLQILTDTKFLSHGYLEKERGQERVLYRRAILSGRKEN